MRSLATVASFALVLSASPVWSQVAAPRPAGQAPAPQRPAAPPAQPPAQTAPAPAPAPAAQTPPPPPPVFPAGAKVGVVNLQQIAALSSEGKASTARINQLIQRKQVEGQQKTKALADNQTKLQQSGALMNETARTALEKEIDRQTRENERFQQDAQAEL